MATILHIVSKSIFFKLNAYVNFYWKLQQLVLKGDYKSKLAQAMAWRRADTKPLPESVVI